MKYLFKAPFYALEFNFLHLFSFKATRHLFYEVIKHPSIKYADITIIF